MPANTESKDWELTITRTFNAPRELVWRAWTDPALATQWMGPRAFRVTEFDKRDEAATPWALTFEGIRPGSEQPVVMRQCGTTLEVRPPELLRYTFRWDPRSCVGLGPSPYEENIVTIRLEEAAGNKTVLHFHQAPFATEGERDGHYGGWNSALDKFAEFLANEQPGRVEAPGDVPSELHMKRTFRAPRELVFDAWTKPEMVAEWWGPKGFRTEVTAWEARSGGAIDVMMIGPDGTGHPMGGRFVEVYPPYRFHFIAFAIDRDGNELFKNWNSVFMEEMDGETTVTVDVHVMSKTSPLADQFLKGMTAGWNSSLDKLETFVNTLALA